VSRAFLTCCDARFLPGAKALLRRVRGFHPDVRRYCYVPAGDLAQARRELDGLAEVALPPGRVSGVPDHFQINIARVFLGALAEDSAVYVDSDTVLCAPIDELWEVNGGELLAVKDLSSRILSTMPHDLKPYYERQFPAVAQKSGFNSGVLALRPAAWRTMPVEVGAAFEAGGYPYYHPLFDQALLNGLYATRARLLDFKFNASSLWDAEIPPDARVVHFSGTPVKPWMDGFPRHAPQYYHWVRHGQEETRWWRLMLVRARIMVSAPRLWLHKLQGRPQSPDPIDAY
jgi:hypothetical protein